MKSFRNVYKNIAPLILRVGEMNDLLQKELSKLDKKEKELKLVNDEVQEKLAILNEIEQVAEVKREKLEELERKL
jgi:Tfp pilus assembly protein PilN